VAASTDAGEAALEERALGDGARASMAARDVARRTLVLATKEPRRRRRHQKSHPRRIRWLARGLHVLPSPALVC
jgi:hypothetical protein